MPWTPNRKEKMIYLSYINLFMFIATFRKVVSLHQFHSLIQNPGKGVNFYGDIQNNPAMGVYNGMSSEDRSRGFDQFDCLDRAYNPSNCVSKSMYQDPGIICEIQNPIPCDYSYPYRTYNGSCNNLHISRLGMKNQCYFRFTPPYYEGFGGFRKSVRGGPLPEPRDISLKIFKDRSIPADKVSFQFVTFGLLVALDLVSSGHPPTDCCSKENANKPECKPISIRPDDKFYSQFNKTCMDFQRTYQCDCQTTHRAQKNGVTSAIDLSSLYSVSEDKAMEIRRLDGSGKLKSNDSSIGTLLLTGKDPADPFCPKLQESECFKGGDPRLNQHASLTGVLTIFLREHNRIATILKQMNPHWEEEKLFQETRKIVIAEFQCIIFKDYLPILVGPRILEEFGMTVKDGSNGMQYDSSVILAIWNEFSTASFRLHSTVPTKIGALHLRFKDTFSNPDLIRQGHLSQLLKGSQKAPSEQFDRYVVTDLTDFLYQMPGMKYGQDLVSFNIQRGRDHGLAPYVDVVKFCSEGTVIISSFDDLHELRLMSESNANLLKQIYASVQDIDMWVGMQLEEVMPGAVTGPSAACINVKQFFFNQKGDRFYFDLEGSEAEFTAAQRSSLKQCSFARLLCDNTDINEITKNPFLLPDKENFARSCNEIPKVDFTLWKDNGNNANTS
ncbi:peroxidase-like [Argiope bruennichi]|uniref:peroxidase-like n=1 Tax=Argiope bruennichi TaxID=94029 RepID=UPI002494AAD0|nr:peroxidase-like [Argiope bruennichi]